MSSIPVYIGRWQDYSSRITILGDVVTLDVRWGGYLIAALSTFIGFVGTAAWTIVAFCIHQSRARSGKADLLFAQQQVIYRNQGSSFSAALDMFKLCRAWRKRKNKPARVEHLKRRSLWLSLPPLLVFVAFTVAGLFIAQVAGQAYQSNNVKVAYNRCGFWQYNASTSQSSAAGQAKISNDTLAGRQYARTCYGSNAPLAECGLYPAQSLPIQTSNVACPFGDDPTGHPLCRYGNNEALQFDTGLLDSSKMLGINAPKQDRLLSRKLVTCSPIYIKNYYNLTQDPNGNYVDQYYLGPIPGAQQAYTWTYKQAAAGDYISYQIESLYVGGGWDPVSALQVPTGDVSLYFLAQNSITYLLPVDDIMFAAHQKVEIEIPEIQNLYKPDQFVNALACVDQYQICNPNSSPLDCTIEGKWSQLVAASQEIGLTTFQQATAERIITPFAMTTTFETVNALSASTLLAQDHVHELTSTGLPSNQWQIEVNGWVSTSLSKLQAYILEYAANLIDLGPYGFVEIPGEAPDPITMALKSMCSQQRIRNTGAYQTFSFLGLMITVCVGSAIILAGWLLEPIYHHVHARWPSAKNDYREVARIADHTLQLQRMALLGAGYHTGWDEETLLDNMPVTEGGTVFPLPSRSDSTEKDYHYAVPEPLMSLSRPETGVHQGARGALPSAHLPNSHANLAAGSGSHQPLIRDSMRSSGASGSGRDRRSSISDPEDQ